MAPTNKTRKWLLAMAQAVARDLKSHVIGTRLRVRVPHRATTTTTDGWAATIGSLGRKGPRLEIWLDRFTSHKDRKLYACFHSEDRRQMTTMTRRVGKKLVPIRVLTDDDTNGTRYVTLTRKLPRAQFNLPILEKYSEGTSYYGLYDVTNRSRSTVSRQFLKHASAFFESVARTLPNAKAEDDSQEAYPQHENRKHVRSHLVRERSQLLATTRKANDGYECQVCGFCFKNLYGKLGINFAEAHHVVPLSKLRENVKTHIEDLVTVCANCHRMLHKMTGKRDDITKLRAIVRKHRRKRK